MTAAEGSTASEVTVQLRVCTNLTKPIQLPPMDKWIIHKDEIVYSGRIICHMEKRGFLTERTNTLKGRHATVTKGGALIIYEEIKFKAGNLLMIAVNDAMGQWRRALHEAIERRQDKDKKGEREEGTQSEEEERQSEVENESKMTVKEDKEEMDNKKKKQVTISAAAPEIISVSPPSLTQTDCESASNPVACLSLSPSPLPVPSLSMFRAELLDLGPALPALIPLEQRYISTASLTLAISSA
ncbi:hypothetical protein WR25_15028 [Diploscapter pachys]|uniref:DUF7778 domain-containing protein n=1 Tax=Diploscapter pachys TaxID=2018661 RepID=A0A2A2LJY2_9BILA|nr:hypothetical protein WR25_15028 [Diploscapter pachys]